VSKSIPSNATGVDSRSQNKVGSPPLFQVLLHNDDYTTMEFVVTVLETVFRKSPTEANRIMLHVHVKGAGVCGHYPYAVAETKVAKVHALARTEGYPLRCSLEEV